MHASLSDICRGDGLVYARVRLDDCIPDGEIFLESFSSENQSLPSRFLAIRSDSGELAVDGIAVVPLVEGRFQTLVFFSVAVGAIVTAEVRLWGVRAWWESKANRMLRKQTVSEVIALADGLRCGCANIRFGIVAPSERQGEFSVHASASFVQREGIDLGFSVLDQNGRRLDVPVLVHTDCLRERSSSSGDLVRTVTFSFVVSDVVTSLVVSAHDCNSENLLGFCALERAALKRGKRAARLMEVDASLDPGYDRWFRNHRATRRTLEEQSRAEFRHWTKFSIVVPLYRTPLAFFEQMLASVLSQSYGDWELVLVIASPDDAQLSDAVSAAVQADGRIRCVPLAENCGIVGNTNAGIGAAVGDFVCFLDHDDTIEPDALYEYARVVERDPDIGMIYCDEDKLTADGVHIDAFFKPDFSIDRLRAHNYLCHFLCVKRSLLSQVEPSAARHEGAQDHDLALKVSELTSRVHHVRKILYHWRVADGSTASAGAAADVPKPYATDAGRLAIEEHLARLGLKAEVEQAGWPYTHRVKYAVQGSPSVSIVVPNRDSVELLDRCLASIRGKTSYPRYEVIVVENNSADPETFEYYRRIQARDDRVRVVVWPGSSEFNYSKIVNFGVSQSSGEYVLLLNNDTEVISDGWLEDLLGTCQRDDVGAVGAKLLFKDGAIQHVGVVLDRPDRPACHLYTLLPESRTGSFLQAVVAGDYSAVTAACMMVSRADFDSVGGFPEELAVLYNDIDFCLKLRERGLLMVCDPAIKLFHYESASRGDDYETDGKRVRAARETRFFYDKWKALIDDGDPFFNPHLVPPYSRLRF